MAESFGDGGGCGWPFGSIVQDLDLCEARDNGVEIPCCLRWSCGAHLFAFRPVIESMLAVSSSVAASPVAAERRRRAEANFDNFTFMNNPF